MRSCPVCSSNNTKIIIDLGDQPPTHIFKPINTEYSFTLKKRLAVATCNNCNFSFNAFSHDSRFDKNYTYLSSTSSTIINFAKVQATNLIEDFKIFNGFEPSSILEIASNDGYFIQELKKVTKCQNIYGIEPSLNAVTISREKGHKVFNGLFNLNEISKIKDFIGCNQDLIIANNVIPHVENIHDFFSSLDIVSNEQTLIAIQFQYFISLFRDLQFDSIYHECHNYFSLKSLNCIVQQYGFKIIRSTPNNQNGGSLMVILCRKSRDINNEEIKLKINKERTFHENLFCNSIEFDSKLKIFKENMRSYIKKIKNSGSKIYGYGAPAKAITMANLFELNNTFIEYIVDINNLKHNKLLPGTDIPIYSVERLILDKAEYVLVFSWNLFPEIKSQLIKMKNFTEIKSVYDFK